MRAGHMHPELASLDLSLDKVINVVTKQVIPFG